MEEPFRVDTAGAGIKVVEYDRLIFWKGESPDGTGLHLLQMGVPLEIYGVPMLHSDVPLEFCGTPIF